MKNSITIWDDIKKTKNKKTEISSDLGNNVFLNFVSLIEFLKQLKINEHKEIKAVHKKCSNALMSKTARRGLQLYY
jgi:hypothetical protein